jgi:hypothetical protein
MWRVDVSSFVGPVLLIAASTASAVVAAAYLAVSLQLGYIEIAVTKPG